MGVRLERLERMEAIHKALQSLPSDMVSAVVVGRVIQNNYGFNNRTTQEYIGAMVEKGMLRVIRVGRFEINQDYKKE